jgi:hypothetical protein
MQELWRNDLVNVSGGSLQYQATATVTDCSDNLFVGGQVRLSGVFPEGIPFVAKFDRLGVKRWEYWPPVSAEYYMVEALASDSNGGVYAALRRSTGGIQMVWLDSRGATEFQEETPNYGTFSSHRVPSVNLTTDLHGGVCLTGIMRDDTNSLAWSLRVARYGASGGMVWRTDLGRGYLPNKGMERVAVVGTNSIYVLGWGDGPISRLFRLDINGEVQWVRDSGKGTMWSELAVGWGETACVAGMYNYQVFNCAGQRLTSHGTWGESTVARTDDSANGFLISDWQSGNLVLVAPNGLIRSLGQFPLRYDSFCPSVGPEMLNVTSNEWLVALDSPESEHSTYTNNLSFFCFDQTGALKWRQRFAGYEYKSSNVSMSETRHWMLRASDGTIRFVANLNLSAANPHQGVAVAAFMLGESTSGPRLTKPACTVTNNRPEGITLEVSATGSGQLLYEWWRHGQGVLGTNSSLQVPAGTTGVYCVRIMDDEGEMASPSMRVRGIPTTLQLGLDQSGSPVLNATGDYAVQVHIESSTNLMDWRSDPVIYSWQWGLPTDHVLGGDVGSPTRFFRAVEIPPQ